MKTATCPICRRREELHHEGQRCVGNPDGCLDGPMTREHKPVAMVTDEPCDDCTSLECHGVDPDDGQRWECPVLETVRKARR